MMAQKQNFLTNPTITIPEIPSTDLFFEFPSSLAAFNAAFAATSTLQFFTASTFTII